MPKLGFPWYVLNIDMGAMLIEKEGQHNKLRGMDVNGKSKLNYLDSSLDVRYSEGLQLYFLSCIHLCNHFVGLESAWHKFYIPIK